MNSKENEAQKIRHIHDHLEYILIKIERFDTRLRHLADVLLTEQDKDWDKVMNPDIDYESEEKQYTSIDDIDKQEHEKRLGEFKINHEIEEANNDKTNEEK
jgi:hypothetical protein